MYSLSFSSCAPLALLTTHILSKAHGRDQKRACLAIMGLFVHARRIEIGMGVLEEIISCKTVHAITGFLLVLMHMEMLKELEIQFLQGDQESTLNYAQLFIRPTLTSSLVRVIFPDSKRITEGPTSISSLWRWPARFHTFPVQLIHLLLTSEGVDNPYRTLLLHTSPHSVTVNKGIRYEFCLRDAVEVRGMMEVAFLTEDPAVVGLPGGRKMMTAARRFMEGGCRFVELDDRQIRGRTQLEVA